MFWVGIFFDTVLSNSIPSLNFYFSRSFFKSLVNYPFQFLHSFLCFSFSFRILFPFVLPYHFNIVSEGKIVNYVCLVYHLELEPWNSLPNQTVRYEGKINIIKYVRILKFCLPYTISKEVIRRGYFIKKRMITKKRNMRYKKWWN